MTLQKTVLGEWKTARPWERISTSHTWNQRLVFACINNSKSSTTGQKITKILKWAKALNQYFNKEDIRRANTHGRSSPASQALRKCSGLLSTAEPRAGREADVWASFTTSASQRYLVVLLLGQWGFTLASKLVQNSLPITFLKISVFSYTE